MNAPTLLPPLFFVSHYHAVSARLRFLVETGSEGMQLRSSLPLPDAATLRRLGTSEIAAGDAVMAGATLTEFCQKLGVESAALELVHDFGLELETDSGPVLVLLARSTEREPFAAPEGLRWIELPESRRLPRLQQNLLRAAYEHYHESTGGGSWMER